MRHLTTTDIVQNRNSMFHSLLTVGAFASVILTGAIFGFFYAWICSTMWGLDTAPARVAVEAMQAMNASVRNAVFAPAFFGTPIVLALTAFAALMVAKRGAAVGFGLAALVYLGGGLILTMLVNVPMNEALALKAPMTEAAAIWADYSSTWQFYNQVRTGFSGIALLLTGIGLRLTA